MLREIKNRGYAGLCMLKLFSLVLKNIHISNYSYTIFNCIII